MPPDEATHNTACESDMHSNHLCYLMSEGFHYSHPDQYKQLVQDAQFRCQNCGRTAKSADSLCAPIKL